MNIAVLFQIAGVGIATAILGSLLKQSGREEMSGIVTIIGLIIGLMMMLSMLGDLFENVKQVFSLY